MNRNLLLVGLVALAGCSSERSETSAFGSATTSAGVLKLTREKAADLIRPKVVATMTLTLPRRFDGSDGYAQTLVKRGIIQTKPENVIPGIVIGEATEFAKPFVLQIIPPGTGREQTPVAILANSRLREITGLRETDTGGKTIEAQFTWDWEPTPVGSKLEGAVLELDSNRRFTVHIEGVSSPAKASCSMFDDGWRCELPNWSATNWLNQQF